MTDRELIELAALAAGYIIVGSADEMVADPERKSGGLVIRNDRGGDSLWHPLKDDADAFRLAVKLTLEVDIHHTGIAVRTPIGHKVLVSADEVKCGYAATRRAITKAAAEIGRG